MSLDLILGHFLSHIWSSQIGSYGRFGSVGSVAHGESFSNGTKAMAEGTDYPVVTSRTLR